MGAIIRDIISGRIRAALEEAQRRGVLPLQTVPEVAIEHPQNPRHGDFATSLPLRLARATRIQPMTIAEELVKLTSLGSELERVWAEPPGFVNFSLKESWLRDQLDAILQKGPDYAALETGQGTKVMVEFVSVNPTGPIHVGHTRGAVLGSTLANVLEYAGYDVTREYYVNDAGSQMEAFYNSLYARYCQALGRDEELPANGYQGDYVIDLAKEVIAQEGERYLSMPREEAVAALGEIGLNRMLEAIGDDLATIGVSFDTWFRERDLYQGKEYDEALELLRRGAYLTEREGALWFTPTSLGEDKDNVVVRSSGTPTYFASDIAYHYNKFAKRGFHRVIDIWGADHQGHAPRMKAAVSALGVDPESLVIIISQMVTLKRGQEVVRASKRSGEFITLRELVEEVGADACRYFFLSRTPETQMDFDLELAKQESSENPVYYVQYAHARIAGILRNAREQGIDWGDGDVSLLTNPNEIALVRKMVLLPELVENMARNLEPHHLPHYALELATAFHWFYERCRVLSKDPAHTGLSKARLKLVEATRIVLARTLGLMGMSAPERM